MRAYALGSNHTGSLLQSEAEATSRNLWFKHNLDALIFSVAEDIVAMRCIIQAQAMGDNAGWVNFATLDPFEKRLHVTMHVRLSHLEGQTLIEGSTDRKLVYKSTIHTGDRHRATFATSLKTKPPE